MYLEIAIWCVLVPFAAVAVGTLISIFLRKFCGEVIGSSLTGITMVVSWCVGVAISNAGRQSWEIWPEDFWRRLIWPLAATSVLLAGLHGVRNTWANVRWPILCLGAAACTYLTSPNTTDWQDVLPLLALWSPISIVSGFLNGWSLEGLARRDATRWVGWVAVAGLAAPTMYALGVYAGLAEFIVAGLTATIVASIAACFEPVKAASSVIYPAALMIGATTTATRYHAYDEPNLLMLVPVLLLPTIIATVDRLIPSDWQWSRILVAAMLASVCLGILGWYLNPEADV